MGIQLLCPHFKELSWKFVAIVENSAVGTLVQTITATDVDEAGTADSAITYGIETVTSLFGIEAETGM